MRYALWMAALLAMASSPAAADVSLDFSSLTGQVVRFEGFGSSAEFRMTTNGSGRGFGITNSSEPSLVGLEGAVLGTYEYSAVTTSGPLQTALVSLKSGPNQFQIWDGSSMFTADVAWMEISTLGASGALNFNALVNLTNFVYSGSNSGLNELLSLNTGSLVASFQFSSPKSLTTLKTLGSVNLSNSYSGSVAVPDGGLTIMLLGGALIGFETLRRRIRVS